MPDPKHIADVRALLAEGKVQEADDQLNILIAADAATAAAAAGKALEPPPPRHRDIIMHDFMATVTGLMGTNARLESLLEEWTVVVQPNTKL